MSAAESLLVLPTSYRPAGQKAFRGQAVSPDVQYLEGVPQSDQFYELTQAFNRHVWVYAAAWAISSNYAGLNFKAYRQAADGMYEEFLDHPFSPLLSAPNPYMSGYNLREFTALSLELTGNAYWVLEKGDRTDGIPKEIWPVPSSYMWPVASKTAPVDHYLYKINQGGGGEPIQFNYDEVIHFQYMNPTSFIFGQGSLEAVKQSVITDIYAQVWNKTFFQNAARPDAVFETDQVLGDDVRKRVTAAWNNMHKGVDKHGKTAILEGGLKLNPLGWKHAEMEFVELRKQMREEILAAFGVPPIMCGILEYANYANAKEQTAIFWKHTLKPKVKCIQDKLNLRIQQISRDSETLFESDLSDVEAIRVDEVARAETCKLYWMMGVPLNQLIDTYDLPFEPVEGGDESRPNLGGGFGAGFGGGIGAGSIKPPAAKAFPVVLNAAAIRVAEWKAYDVKIRPIEERYILSLRGYFRGQYKRVIDAFGRHGPHLLTNHGIGKAQGSGHGRPRIDVSVFFDDKKEERKLQDVSHDYISGTYVDFGVEAARKLKNTFRFDMQDPHVLHWITEKELKLVRDVTEYTKESLSEAAVDSIQEAVAEGWKQSETIAEITARIKDVYDLAAETRAERIARTEILSASNAGSLEGMNQAGAEGKQWISSHDDRVRESHAELDGKTIPMGEDFQSITGATLNAPGDPDAAASEIINCRCTLRSIRKMEDGGDQ